MTHNTPFFHTPSQKNNAFFSKNTTHPHSGLPAKHLPGRRALERAAAEVAGRQRHNETSRSEIAATCFVKLLTISDLCRSTIPLPRPLAIRVEISGMRQRQGLLFSSQKPHKILIDVVCSVKQVVAKRARRS